MRELLVERKKERGKVDEKREKERDGIPNTPVLISQCLLNDLLHSPLLLHLVDRRVPLRTQWSNSMDYVFRCRLTILGEGSPSLGTSRCVRATLGD